MGTAGPLGLARHILDEATGEPFFVLNRCKTFCCGSMSQIVHAFRALKTGACMQNVCLFQRWDVTHAATSSASSH